MGLLTLPCELKHYDSTVHSFSSLKSQKLNQYAQAIMILWVT